MEVIFYNSARKYTGGTVSVKIEPECCPDLRSLINELGVRFGDTFKKLLQGGETWLVLINSKTVMNTGGPETPLNQGDIIEVLPMVGAG